MARRLSKLERLSAIENEIAEADITTATEQLADMSTAAEKATEAIQQVEQAAAEATGYHEDRDWESRDGSVEEIGDALSELEEALGELREFTPDFIAQLADHIEDAHKRAAEAREHLDHLV